MVEMETIIGDVLKTYGPLGIGWVVSLFLLWKVFSDRKDPNGALKAYQQIAGDYYEAITNNTRMLERLITLVEERTRLQDIQTSRVSKRRDKQ